MSQPKIKLLKRKGLRLEFYIDGFDVTLLNAIRRTTIADVPSVAIDTVGKSNQKDRKGAWVILNVCLFSSISLSWARSSAVTDSQQ